MLLATPDFLEFVPHHLKARLVTLDRARALWNVMDKSGDARYQNLPAVLLDTPPESMAPDAVQGVSSVEDASPLERVG